MKKGKNRRRVYESLFEQEGDEAFCIKNLNSHDNTGYAAYGDTERAIHRKYRLTNPDKGVMLIRWFYALGNAGFPREMLTPKKLRIVYNKYHERYYKEYYFKEVRDQNAGVLPGKLPQMGKTEAILEFIARGFRYEDEVRVDRINKYCVKCNIAPLWWPKDFDSHQDAINIQTKFGIHGYTGTTLPRR